MTHNNNQSTMYSTKKGPNQPYQGPPREIITYHIVDRANGGCKSGNSVAHSPYCVWVGQHPSQTTVADASQRCPSSLRDEAQCFHPITGQNSTHEGGGNRSNIDLRRSNLVAAYWFSVVWMFVRLYISVGRGCAMGIAHGVESERFQNRRWNYSVVWRYAQCMPV
jgi:hypothetical protein